MVQHLVKFKCHFSWQAQYLVMLNCHFAWQAQYSVKFGVKAEARNVVFFSTKCSWLAPKVTSVARRVADGRFHGRILLGSFSDPARIGPALEMTFQLFSRNLLEILVAYWSSTFVVQSSTGVVLCSTD